ncbi:E1-E2 ATPase-domain-containing protein, partial [Aspergillus oleicola]
MSRSATPALPFHNAQASGSRTPSATPAGIRTSVQPSASTSTYSQLDPQETADRLQTSLIHGLTPAEAEIRYLRDGPNELPHEEPEPLWLRFLKQFKETLILLLLASAAISFFMGNLDDAVSITLAVTIVVTVGFVQEYRSEKSLDALNRLVPHHAHLIRDVPLNGAPIVHPAQAAPDEEVEMQDLRSKSPSSSSVSAAVKASTTVPAAELVAGDMVLFAVGDRIPADIRITAATDLSIDESNLTGENEPVVKYPYAIRNSRNLPTHTPKIVSPPRSPFYDAPASGAVGADIRLNEQHNIAFMGTLVRSGYGQGIVIGTGAKTEFGSISASLQEIESPRTPLQLSMDRLGQELSYMSFGVIALIVVVGLIQGRKLLDMFTIGVSLAVAAIPEGLPIIVTVTLALGVLRMASKGAIMRRLPSVETLGSVNVVCSDKTGTLTLNHMTVTKMWHFDCPEPFEVHNDIHSLTPGPAARTVLRIGNIANNARLSRVHANSPASASSAAVLSSTDDNTSGSMKSRWVGQPTDVAILDLLDAFGEDDVRERLSARVAETPFSSERKWMGVVIGSGTPGESPASAGGSSMAYIKGALEQVLARCDTYLTKEGQE